MRSHIGKTTADLRGRDLNWTYSISWASSTAIGYSRTREEARRRVREFKAGLRRRGYA